jgi:penicillin amidase
MVTLNETLQVAGGDPVPLTVRYTRHGPLIWSDVALKEFRGKAGIDLPENYALALRWTALEPSRTFAAVWKMDQAQNWYEFRQAAREFDVPSQNFVYADVDGNIGYQTPGKIPIRTNGIGILPVPGWNDSHEWVGYIPFEKLPYAFNPPQGYIATANNAVVGTDYPYLLTTQWDYGFRADRIVEMIENAPGPIDSAYIQKIQGDNKNQIAELLVPVLMQIQLDDARLEKARQVFEGWDYQQPMDSAPAALFGAFWKYLLADTFNDDLPEAYWPDGSDRWFEVIRRIAEQPISLWWDNKTTAQEEYRDQIFRQAFGQAVDELEKNFGKNPQRWKWGDMHRLMLVNQTLGKSGIGLIESLFNRGPFPTSGGSSLVNNTGWNASLSEEAESQPYDVALVPSMRMIVDLSNFQDSLTINLTGQSGHAYHPHYYDMTDKWRNIQYHPMIWAPAPYKDHLRLVP